MTRPSDSIKVVLDTIDQQIAHGESLLQSTRCNDELQQLVERLHSLLLLRESFKNALLAEASSE